MMKRSFIVFLLLSFFCSAAYSEEPYIYDSAGRRDPFVPLVGVTSKTVESLEDIVSIEDVDLQGIARDSSGRKVAIVNGEMIKENETVGHLTIKEIHTNGIVLTIDEDEYKLNIYEK